MKDYELMFILPPDLGEEGAEKAVKEIREAITEEGNGKISEEDLWGVRELAYRIKGEEEAFYGVLLFSIDPSQVEELEKSLNLNSKVLRFLISKPPENYELKTYSEYMKEWEMEDKKEEEAKKEEKEKKRPGVRKTAKKAAVTPAPAAKKEPAKEPKKEEVSEEDSTGKEAPNEKEPSAEKETSTEKEAPTTKEKPDPKKEEPKKTEKSDIDSKLKSIIDDPDISL